MGVLVNYKLDLSPEDVVLIGEALDLLPHGRVQKLFAKIQPQLSEQEAAERARLAAEQEASVERWREIERTKLKSALAKPIKPKNRSR